MSELQKARYKVAKDFAKSIINMMDNVSVLHDTTFGAITILSEGLRKQYYKPVPFFERKRDPVTVFAAFVRALDDLQALADYTSTGDTTARETVTERNGKLYETRTGKLVCEAYGGGHYYPNPQDPEPVYPQDLERLAVVPSHPQHHILLAYRELYGEWEDRQDFMPIEDWPEYASGEWEFEEDMLEQERARLERQPKARKKWKKEQRSIGQ